MNGKTGGFDGKTGRIISAGRGRQSHGRREWGQLLRQRLLPGLLMQQRLCGLPPEHWQQQDENSGQTVQHTAHQHFPFSSVQGNAVKQADNRTQGKDHDSYRLITRQP
ncbi:hypothetical protein QDX92_002215 [Salmonella enterica]|nr:hypothetical protein [Salmonella enterica]EJF5922139.1 hypothetical protein [Salmonella enterica]EJH7819545.1 hypothetical protein [Salmonella enterica]EJW2053416.1 hypothetical protein [Salmonella enterica]EJW2206350.1 hypothetical protein [Salmonella enterica]